MSVCVSRESVLSVQLDDDDDDDDDDGIYKYILVK